MISVWVLGKANSWPSLCFFYAEPRVFETKWLQLWQDERLLSRSGYPLKETLPSNDAYVLKVLAEGATRYLREAFDRICQHYALPPPTPPLSCLTSYQAGTKPPLVHGAAGRQVSSRGLCAVASSSVEYGPGSSETDQRTAETQMLMLE